MHLGPADGARPRQAADQPAQELVGEHRRGHAQRRFRGQLSPEAEAAGDPGAARLGLRADLSVPHPGRADAPASDRHRAVQICRVQAQRAHDRDAQPGLLEAGAALSRRHRIHRDEGDRAARPRLLRRAARHGLALRRVDPDPEGLPRTGAAGDLRDDRGQCAAHDADQPVEAAVRQPRTAPGDGAVDRPRRLCQDHHRRGGPYRRDDDAAPRGSVGHAGRDAGDPARLRPRRREEPRRGPRDHGEARLRARQAPPDQAIDPRHPGVARPGGAAELAIEGNLHRHRARHRRHDAVVPEGDAPRLHDRRGADGNRGRRSRPDVRREFHLRGGAQLYRLLQRRVRPAGQRAIGRERPAEAQGDRLAIGTHPRRRGDPAGAVLPRGGELPAALCQRADDNGQQHLQRLADGRRLARSVALYQNDRIQLAMRFLSTRDARPQPATYSFEDVLLAGLAEDGGLYVPEALPSLDLAQLSALPYADLAARIVGFFAGENFGTGELRRLSEAAYTGFRHPAVTPLVQLDHNLWLLELFHGPTLAFKDLALQLLGQLFDAALARRGERVTIVGATSGDTGSAALDACRDRSAIDIFFLYPHGRISEVQRRQMTTIDAPNAHAVAIDGTFDDCQDLVKALFADQALHRDLNLSAMNSINFARIAAQIVYYVAAGLALGAPGRAVSFTVPTGNFGNIYAAHLARAMGLPIERLVLATNANDILARYLTSGEMSLAPVNPSLSPSMDIQVASNFERLLFELKGRNGAAVSAAIAAFRAGGTLPQDDQAWHAAAKLFAGHRLDDAGTLTEIGETYRRSGILVDPHTAIGIAAARALKDADDHGAPIVALATAHPAKFGDAVERATGVRPVLPSTLADVMERQERITVLPNDVAAVSRFVRERA